MSQVDLERLRHAVLDGRKSREERPRDKRRKVFVDPSGRVILGDDLGEDEGRQLSEVHLAVFA